MRVKRIGSTTSGLILIAAGLTFLISSLLDSRAVLDWALKLWPLTLVSLGIEILFAQRKSQDVERKYDFLSVLMSFFCVAFVFACEIARILLVTEGFWDY